MDSSAEDFVFVEVQVARKPRVITFRKFQAMKKNTGRAWGNGQVFKVRAEMKLCKKNRVFGAGPTELDALISLLEAYKKYLEEPTTLYSRSLNDTIATAIQGSMF